MKRLFRSLSKRSLRKEEKEEILFSPTAQSFRRDTLWTVVEDETWSYNRLKDDEAAEQSSLRISPRVSSFELPNNTNVPRCPSPQKRPEKMYQDGERRTNLRAKGHSSSSSEDSDPVQAIYGSTDIPFFGSQYGLTPNSEICEKIESIQSSYYDQMAEQMAALKFYEELMYNASPDLQRAAAGKAETGWGNDSKIAVTTSPDFASKSKSIPSHDIQESYEMYDIQYNEPTALPPDLFGFKDAEAAWRTAFGTTGAHQVPEPSVPESSKAEGTASPQELPTDIHRVMIPSSSWEAKTSLSNAPTSCIICTEDFTSTLQPPPWITHACTHAPSVCTPCLSKCISNDLTSKIWNQIKCPECSIPLVYEDIKRLATPSTFAKYEDLSFRSAMSSDSDFIWCQAQNCDFGQLHTTGMKQPIVRCKKCGFRSCFKHGVAWHERLTCDEYDEMKKNPMGFKSMLEREEEERLAEEERQRQRHETELARAREQQAAEAERRKLEVARRQREEERKRQVEERRREEEERQKQKQAVWKRHMEEEASMSTVERTTKKCPGCTWPIEKNQGCQHMTCISCCSQWCWDCLADHTKIVMYGNDWHNARCPHHTDNLPPYV